MSAGISGKIEFIEMKEFEEISFKIQEIAIKNGLGCRLGCNVSERVIEMYGDEFSNNLYFEIMDSPFENYADYMLSPEICGDMEYDTEFKNKFFESLNRIRNFSESVINMNCIKCIWYDINYLFRDKLVYKELSLQNMNEYIYENYIKEGYFVPTIGVKIIKNDC